MVAMSEPHASELRRLVRLGAGARDIHVAEPALSCSGIGRDVGFARREGASDSFVERELARVETHRRGSCSLLEAFVGRTPRILDVGCSTGATAVALALSPVLAPEVVVGVDPDTLSLHAAEVRAKGHGLDARRVSFARNRPCEALPFEGGSFDLVVCVSVLEFLPTVDARRQLAAEMARVTRPGGHVFVATPSPLRARDVHARRWLGDFFRRRGYPWASAPWAVRAMFRGCDRVPTDRWVVTRAFGRAGLSPNVTRAVSRSLPERACQGIALAHAWQKVLLRKPSQDHAVAETVTTSARGL
jgi:SAM-dependent methyltransferase